MRPRTRVLASLVILSVMRPCDYASGQRPGEASKGQGSVVGRVVDERKAPVPSADVSLVDEDSVLAHTRTSAAGTFELRAVPSGAHLIVVRRLGYRVRRVEVDVSRQSPARVDIELIAMPKELEQVRVEAKIDDSKGKLREFYQHKARAQFGYFFGPEDLDRDNVRNTSDMMRRVPGAKLSPARFGHRVLFRGCSPLVVIDGQRVVGAELDEITDIDDVAALEVYPSMAGLPPQYVGHESRCGVIVVWTKVS